VESTVAVF
jgi:hypothetical protein